MVNLMFLGSIFGRLGAWGFLLLGSFLGGLGWQGGAIAPAGPFQSHPVALNTCPQDLEFLISRMLPDLPAYTNRTHIRLGIPQHYLILAGRPEFEPLPLSLGSESDSASPAKLHSSRQVFLTTLVRNYRKNRPPDTLQGYHWLFFTPDQGGWQLSRMYSILGSYPSNRAATSPRDSSGSPLAQAIQTWLRDCRAGLLAPIPTPPLQRS